jgi:hypothetical protein
MSDPRIEVLGVYRLDVTEELFREQFSILYSRPMTEEKRVPAEESIRELLESTVLIEVLVSNRDERFNVGDFGTYSGQVAYAEAYLSQDGEALLVEGSLKVPPDDPLRIAFFLAEWSPEWGDWGMLLTTYGKVQCPLPQQMPDRLKRLVPFPLFD